MPCTREYLRNKYCQGNFTACARFLMATACGREKMPEHLLPGDVDSAAIATGIRIVEAGSGDNAARLAFMRDITDPEGSLNYVIARLEDEKPRFEAIIDAIGAGLTIHDIDFRIIYQNQVHKEIMGDYLGAYCYEAYTGRGAVCEDCHMRATLQDGRIHTAERRHSTGQGIVYLEITVSPLKDAHGRVIACIEVVRNITERKQKEENLRYISSHDILTGLHNRYYFEQEIVRLERGRHFPVSIVMVDVDGLKEVNDKLGHAVGDTLLWQTAVLLRKAFRSEDVVARIGGDEIAVLLPDTGNTVAQEMVARIRKRLRKWNASHDIPISLSIGVATAENGSRLLEAQNEADQRIFKNKLSRKEFLRRVP